MAGTFIDMVNRIATELRRSNTPEEIKNAINDAIAEASTYRFSFNEYDSSFPTVAGQEYYPDLGYIGLDAVWYLDSGVTRYNVELVSQDELNELAAGNVTGGTLLYIAHYGSQFRLYPIPSTVYTLYLQGFGTMAGYPLVNDADTTLWLTGGEQYIRALAKRNFLRDVVRDYGEARVYDIIAEDYKDLLSDRNAVRSATGTIRGTQF